MAFDPDRESKRETACSALIPGFTSDRGYTVLY